MSPPLVRSEAIAVRRRLFDVLQRGDAEMPELMRAIRQAAPDEVDCAFRWAAGVLTDLAHGNGAWHGHQRSEP